MTKKILMIALAATCGLGFSAMAQTQTECTQQANCPLQGTPGQNNKMYQPREFNEIAFEGILLTPEQQIRVDSLNAAMKANCPGQKQCDKANCKKEECKKQDCKNCECKKDSANCDKKDCKKADKKALDKAGKKGRKGEGRVSRRAYIQKAKEILTPEQYTQFLENIAMMPGRPGEGQAPDMQKGKLMKDGKEVKAVKGAKKMRDDVSTKQK